MMMAVPVSWHPGKTMPAAMLAFFRSSSATKRSLSDASGSSRMARSCAKWPGRSRCAMSVMPSCATRRSASGSTFSTSRPSTRSTETCSSVILRQGMALGFAGSDSNRGWKWNGAGPEAFAAIAAVVNPKTRRRGGQTRQTARRGARCRPCSLEVRRSATSSRPCQEKYLHEKRKAEKAQKKRRLSSRGAEPAFPVSPSSVFACLRRAPRHFTRRTDRARREHRPEPCPSTSWYVSIALRVRALCVFARATSFANASSDFPMPPRSRCLPSARAARARGTPLTVTRTTNDTTWLLVQNGQFIPDKSNIWRDCCDGYYDWVRSTSTRCAAARRITATIPMLLAAGNGHTTCCDLLISEGADIEQAGLMKRRPSRAPRTTATPHRAVSRRARRRGGAGHW